MISRLVLALAVACAGFDAAAQGRAIRTVDNDLFQVIDISHPVLRLPGETEGGASLATSGMRLGEAGLRTPLIDLTADHDDLFVRLRSGFSIPDINNDLVLYHQQWYLNRPDYLRRMVERSKRYLHHVVEELERRGLPTELALLPMVESAYNPMAYSTADAAGLWQFIPTTGKHFNLRQDWWVDQRRDVIASTNAALDYLKTLYEMHGDWHLALASYNWGEGAVGRAVARNRAKGLPGDYLSLTMPNETRHYVPKLQALKNIFGNPETIAELGLAPLPNRPYFTTLAWPANIDINVAAQLAEMPVSEFIALNPAHNRPVITADTPMVLPTEKLATFKSNLEQRQLSEQPLSFWRTYTLRPGEKLEKVAPQFGMSVADLKAINGIRGGIKPPPGLTLLVAAPEGGGTLDTDAAATSHTLLAHAQQPAAEAKATVPVRTHLVRPGDSLAGIARTYGMKPAELKQLNPALRNKLKPGMKLALRSPDQGKAEPAASAKQAKLAKRTGDLHPAAARKAVASRQKPPRIATYTIRRGDTLASIARQFKIDSDDLRRLNRIQPNRLQPGQTLTIRLGDNG